MLEEYARKRRFNVTPEPSSTTKRAPRKGNRLEFVVQKHSASHLHFDFRIEVDGVLVSWAVPKGPSLDPSEKRLAMHVEDHPFEYRKFEGIIPEGQYGAGEVIVWDKGTYEYEDAEGKSKDAQAKSIKKAIQDGKLTIDLHGKRLNGKFTLVRTKGDKQWLMFKKNDEYAVTGADITDDDDSVLSKKNLADLQKKNGKVIKLSTAKRKPFVPKERKTVLKKKSNTSKKVAADKSPSPLRKKSTVERMPSVQPMFAKLVDAPFTGDGWIFEPKLDGIRAVAYIKDGAVELVSRRGLDLTGRYPRLENALAKFKGNMILDGEIVALDEKGRPSFQLLQQRSGQTNAHAVNQAETRVPIVYYPFDILYANGQKLFDLSLKERKDLLAEKVKESDVVKLVHDLGGDGIKAFQACVETGLEGLVAKRVESTYHPGKRTNDWLKVKSHQSSEFLICGYTKGTGSRNDTFGALILGYYSKGELKYAGGVGTGFNQKSLQGLQKLMRPLERKTSPFAQKIPGQSKIQWLTPQLVAEVKFGEWTRDGILRIPVFMRLREDIEPAKVGPVPEVDADSLPGVTEVADESDMAERESKKTTKKNSRKTDDADSKESNAQLEALLGEIDNSKETLTLEVDGHKINYSNLNKVMWPELGETRALTKRDYLRYLIQVSPYILPHLKDRPLTLIRFPNGINGQKFFQKHWDKNLPEHMDTIDYFSEHNNSDEKYLICNSLPGLLWLAQIADLEIHLSHTRRSLEPDAHNLTSPMTGSAENIERSVLNYPDFMVIDLDPYLYSGKEKRGAEPELHKKGFRKTCEIALMVKEILDHLKIKAFVKTSGRTGLHIYVPLVRNIDYPTVRELAKNIGEHVLKSKPDDVTMVWAVKGRTGKVFFDHNMNGRGKTLPSPYSARVAPEASVSMPVDWDELNSIYPTDFSILTAPERLARVGDLWKTILANKNDLTVLLRKIN